MKITLEDNIRCGCDKDKAQRWVESTYRMIDASARKVFPVWTDTKGNCVYIRVFTSGLGEGETIPFSELGAVVKDWLDEVHGWFVGEPNDDTVENEEDGESNFKSSSAKVLITLDGALEFGFYITACNADGEEMFRLTVVMDKETQRIRDEAYLREVEESRAAYAEKEEAERIKRNSSK